MGLLKATVQALSAHPEAVKVEGYESAHQVVFDIHVHRDDASTVIGRGGAGADLLRDLFGAIYGRLNKQLHLHVIDPRR
jgi:predicted RNA-binding protein YlqC (UPF0109 family)